MKAWADYKGAVLGTVCKRGHDHGGGSYRANRKCVECASLSSKVAGRAYRQRNPGVAGGATGRWRKKHQAKSREHNETYRKKNMSRFARYAATRRAMKLHATPPWADLREIQSKYDEAARRTAETGIIHEVDHDIPLQHPKVCGLHVSPNLSVVTRSLNRSKCNKFEVLAC